MKEVQAVTLQFTITMKSILMGKLFHFLKKSLFRYLMACAMVSMGTALLTKSNLDAVLKTSTFTILTVFSLATLSILLSSYYFFKKYKSFNMTITFNAEEIITVKPDSTVETKSWDWIIKGFYSRKAFYLQTMINPRLYFILDEAKVPEKDYIRLKGLLAMHSKL